MMALPSPGKASSCGEMTFPVDSRSGVVRAWELCGDPSVSFDFKALRRLQSPGAFAFLGHCRGVVAPSVAAESSNQIRPIDHDAPSTALSQQIRPIDHDAPSTALSQCQHWNLAAVWLAAVTNGVAFFSASPPPSAALPLQPGPWLPHHE
jgi:hypothetical protein